MQNTHRVSGLLQYDIGWVGDYSFFDFIKLNIYKLNEPNETNTKTTTAATIPHIKDTSETIARIFNQSAQINQSQHYDKY